MARYNSISSTSSVAGGSTISTPASGLLTTLTGTGTVTIPNPVLYTGQTQTFYNSTASAITLSTPSGNFIAPGIASATTISIPAGSIFTAVSDGANYVTQAWLGGAVSTTNLVATGGSINGINIGATTTGTGAFSTLNVTSTTALAGVTATTGAFSGISTFTNNAAATLGTTGTGALQVAGGASIAGILNVGGATYHAGTVGIGNTGALGAQNLHVGSTAGGGSINGYTRLAVEAGDYAVTTMKSPAANFSQIIFTDPTSTNLGGINFFNSTNATPNAMTFLTGGGNERMRIDSSGNVGIGTTVMNVYDAVASNRPLVVAKSDASTSNIGNTASITISNLDTTANNVSQINFAAITGANTNHFSSAIISAIHGARTNGQYPAGILTFSTSTALNNAPSEKMRIEPGGTMFKTKKVGMGTQSGNGKEVQSLSWTGSATNGTIDLLTTTGFGENGHCGMFFLNITQGGKGVSRIYFLTGRYAQCQLTMYQGGNRGAGEDASLQINGGTNTIGLQLVFSGFAGTINYYVAGWVGITTNAYDNWFSN